MYKHGTKPNKKYKCYEYQILYTLNLTNITIYESDGDNYSDGVVECSPVHYVFNTAQV